MMDPTLTISVNDLIDALANEFEHHGVSNPAREGLACATMAIMHAINRKSPGFNRGAMRKAILRGRAESLYPNVPVGG